MKRIILLMAMCFLNISAYAQTANDELWKAIRNNDTKGVESILNNSTIVTKATDINYVEIKPSPNDFSLYQLPFKNSAFKPLLEINKYEPSSVLSMSMSALMRASWYGYTEIITLLLEKGADVNAKNDEGMTALMCASVYGYTEIITLLLKKGADINATDEDGKTALIYASTEDGYTNRNTEAIEFLIKRGANVNATDKYGRTALMMASAYGFSGYVALLKKYGAKE